MLNGWRWLGRQRNLRSPLPIVDKTFKATVHLDRTKTSSYSRDAGFIGMYMYKTLMLVPEKGAPYFSCILYNVCSDGLIYLLSGSYLLHSIY